MPDLDKASLEPLALLTETAAQFAADPDRALTELFGWYLRAHGSSSGALYRIEARGAPSLAAGEPDPALRAAVIAAREGRASSSPISVTLLRAGNNVIGALALRFPGADTDSVQSGGRADPAALISMFALGLQATRWRYEAEHARERREKSSFRTLTHYTENILRSIAAGVVTINKNGLIETWNARAEEIVNIKARHITGKHYRQLIRLLRAGSDVRDETIRMLPLIAGTGKVFTHNKLRYHAPDGDAIYINLSASQLKSEAGEYLGVVVVFEDITSDVLMKEEVERFSRLAEAGELAANIAHELRNPLSSIKGAAQLLRGGFPSDASGEYGEFLDIIIEEVNGLNRMTTEFLEFARTAPAEMQRVDLNALAGRRLQFMSAYLTEQSVILNQSFDPGIPDITVDKLQIEQVIKNIVINAAQAMPDGGSLTVTTQYDALRDTAEITFTDTGIGIQPSRLEKIWTPFFTTKTKGTGLGLAIARRIVETHGGRLTVSSTPGAGSTFTMVLPTNSGHSATMRPGRAEITEQRSDQPGGAFDEDTVYDSQAGTPVPQQDL